MKVEANYNTHCKGGINCTRNFLRKEKKPQTFIFYPEYTQVIKHALLNVHFTSLST